MVAWGANPVRLGGDWSGKGDRKGETLWPLFFSIFRALPNAQPFQGNAAPALNGMVLAHGTANIADQFFGWRPCGWG